MRTFRDQITEIMPIEFAAEPGVETVAREGATLTGKIPARGTFQVRVESETENEIILATVQGHPLAGIVKFTATPAAEKVRFAIEIYARPSNIVDWIAVRLGGAALQNHNWRKVLGRVVELSGGEAREGVQSADEALSDDEIDQVQRWADELIQERKATEMKEQLAAVS